MFRRNFVIILGFIFYFSSVGWIWHDSIAKKNKDGVKLYNKGDIKGALSKWRDAQIDSPEKEGLHYNIGNGLHLEKKYEEAYNEYEKSVESEDDELKAKAYYNKGNTDYRMGKLPEAIEDYENALLLNPDDEDAKYNIEFIKKKLKENLEKEKEKGADSQQKQAQEQNGQEHEPQEARGSEEKGAGEEKKEENGTQIEQGEEKQGEMSKEDAIRLLDALKDDEKSLQKDLRTFPSEGRYRVEKDW